MKKLLGIVVLSLLWCNSSNAGTHWGEGELQLSDRVAAHFIHFIRGKSSKHPGDFYVTLDGTDYIYWYCSYGPTRCVEGSPVESIKRCKRITGKKCKKFAFRRIVKWKNGINRASKFNSKWSDSKMYEKLTELGFYKNDFSNKITKSESKDNTVDQLETLIKLYEDGILTKEEFEKAKKKILN